MFTSEKNELNEFRYLPYSFTLIDLGNIYRNDLKLTRQQFGKQRARQFH